MPPRPHSRTIGAVQVTTVSDGVLNATLNNFLGVTPAEAERMSGFPVAGPVPLAVNAFLLQFDGRRALVDAGIHKGANTRQAARQSPRPRRPVRHNRCHPADAHSSGSFERP